MPFVTKIVESVLYSVSRLIFLRLISKMSVGSLELELPNGKVHKFNGSKSGPKAKLNVHSDEFFYRLLRHGEIGFGEAYMDDLLSSPDMVELVSLAIGNRKSVDFNSGPIRLLSAIFNRRLHLSRKNTIEQAKRNIHEHYDLGNDFFALWLDSTMTYSSAKFESDDQPIEQAQLNKYRTLCELANVTASTRLLEIGTGWGGFAMFAAKEYGCKVHTVTISQEQRDLALSRVTEAGLANQIEILLSDYRDIEGEFDAIISIEMFEAVGSEYFSVFFKKCDDLLVAGGKLCMQVITVPDSNYKAQKDGVNWIQKYIFPGGVLPSVEEMDRATSNSDLVMKNYSSIGYDYAETLKIWRRNFWEKVEDIKELGYPDRFIRMWDYYLALCEAGFKTDNTDDVHIIFEKALTK